MENQQLDKTESALFDHPDFVEMIETLMGDSESSEVEFKSAKGGFPNSLWKTYFTFANTQGGVIVLGVKEKDGNSSIDCLTRNEMLKYKKTFWDNVNNKQKFSVNILKDSDVQTGVCEGNHVLVFNIPRADRSQIPVYLNGNPDNTYKRNHEGDYKCTFDEVRRMFSYADVEHPCDSRILPEFSIEADIDIESLNQYRRMVAAIKPTHPWLLLDHQQMLTKLGGYRVDRREKIEGLTFAGMLMFGKIDSITDTYCCPSYFPDYREYNSLDPQHRWTNRIYPDGTWEANLFQFYMVVSIDHHKLLTLATCCSEGEVTNNRLQLIIDKHRSNITRLLRELSSGKYFIIATKVNKSIPHLKRAIIPQLVRNGLLERENFPICQDIQNKDTEQRNDSTT